MDSIETILWKLLKAQQVALSSVLKIQNEHDVLVSQWDTDCLVSVATMMSDTVAMINTYNQDRINQSK